MRSHPTSVLLRVIIALQLLAFSCGTVDLYEKSVTIPEHAWQSSFKPSFTFTIVDTISPFEIMMVLRHNEKYNFKNIYINLHAQLPGADTPITIRRDLTLASNEGWLASGMDDIYEHRLSLGKAERLKAGAYTFTLEHIMREDPLKNVLNVGLRLEKKQPR